MKAESADGRRSITLDAEGLAIVVKDGDRAFTVRLDWLHDGATLRAETADQGPDLMDLYMGHGGR